MLLPALDISERRQVAELEVPATASGPATVLVADDEPAVRTLVKDALETFGFDVLLAKDGLECVEIYKERGHEVDAVLLDMTMPRLDGEQTFRELRRIDPAVRVLLTSGYNEVDATARFAGKGLAGFLQKPFRVAQLVAQLEALVGRTP